MMLADGEEPVGVRVLTYQSSRSINTILNALNEDEIRYLRESSFGILVEIAEKPDIYYRNNFRWKKHEAWFRFAEKPIRFFFALVRHHHWTSLRVRTQLNRKPWSYGIEHSPPYVQNIDQHFLKYLALNPISDKQL
ncbi:hypothetical protein HID58_006840, partial [Brassica napus]